MNSPETGDAVKRIKGIDVSHYNGVIDWKKVKEAGYEFAFLKATEGGDWVDQTFAENRKAARAAGVSVGFYHFFRPSTPVDLQVANFVKTVGKLEQDALRPVLDIEDPRLWKNLNVRERVTLVLDWCQKIKATMGVTPMIYGSPNFFSEVLQNAPELAAYDLWIANYNTADPIVPKPWTKWTFWQHSDKGTVPGINGDVDLNWFSGSDLAQPRNSDTDIPNTPRAQLIFKIVVGTLAFLYLAGLVAIIAERFYN